MPPKHAWRSVSTCVTGEEYMCSDCAGRLLQIMAAVSGQDYGQGYATMLVDVIAASARKGSQDGSGRH